jgi:hypothetical protein
MSNRERWVVYPLLFLAIGLGLNNNIQLQEAQQDGHSAQVDLLRCKTLEVVAADGKPRVTISTTDQGEAILETASAAAKPLARIGSNSDGAVLSLFDRTGQSMFRLGYENQFAMLLVLNPSTGKAQQLYSVPLILLPRDQNELLPLTDGQPKSDAETKSPEK